jgi:hypothetical protein
MKKTVALATFAVAGSGALGAGAVSVNGSDTLDTLTSDMVNANEPFSTPPISPANPAAPICAGPYVEAQAITYLGGGSGLGEAQMAKGLQEVAPMSRFLAGAPGSDPGTVCNPAVDAGSPTTAEGLVIALDAIVVVGSASNAGTTTCNGTRGLDSGACTPDAGADTTTGVAWSTTIPRTIHGVSRPYTLGNWQDVLNILYFGIVNPNFNHASDPEVGKNCNSAIRNAIANNWGNFFQNQSCSGAAGDGNSIRCAGSGPCPCVQIQHAFRLDDASGTSDIFTALLGASPLPSATANPVPTAVGNYGIGADPFCNDVANAGGTAWPGSNSATTVVPNDDQDYDPIRRPCAGGGGLSKGTAGNPNGSEQVCERGTANSSATATATASGGGVSSITVTNPGSGYTASPDVIIYGGKGTGATATATLNSSGGVASITVTNPGTGYIGGFLAVPQVTIAQWTTGGSLGLLLPVITATNLATTAHSEDPNIDYQYNVNTTTNLANECNGPSIQVAWPGIPKPPGTGNGNNPGLCPNGDLSGATGSSCFVPADSSGNPNCISYFARQSTPAAATCSSNQGSPDGITCSTSGPAPNTVDVRTYNLYSYSFNAGTSVWSLTVDSSGRPILAFYRIHTSQDMLLPNQPNTRVATSICTYSDATQQIGCLVQASPCSIGYTGRTGLTASMPLGGTTANSVAMNILGVPPSTACVQTYAYKYSRKLYLDTLLGFGALPSGDPQLVLAQCEADPTRIVKAVDFRGFVDLPDSGFNSANGAQGGSPLCESFNEQAQCGINVAPSAGPPANHCANNGTTGIPTSGTMCGNGIREAFEDCDDGVAGTLSANGGAGNTTTANPDGGQWCTPICRFGK